MNLKKAAVVFPGIGYHTDKPLLYYGKKLAAARGYEIVDVPYGNPTFIDDGKNGYLIPVGDRMTVTERIDALARCTVMFFTEADRGRFSAHSYETASSFLTEKVMKRWEQLIKK